MTFNRLLMLLFTCVLLFSDVAQGEYTRRDRGYTRPMSKHNSYYRPSFYSRRRGMYPRQGTEITGVEAEFLDSSRCDWVASADDAAEIKDTVPAHPVHGCEAPGEEPPMVCTGTIRCNTDMGGTKFTYYVEHSMCVSKWNEGCPTAERCLRDGGALADMRVADLVGGGKTKKHQHNENLVDHYDR